jgi:hypothetical protein
LSFLVFAVYKNKNKNNSSKNQKTNKKAKTMMAKP